MYADGGGGTRELETHCHHVRDTVGDHVFPRVVESFSEIRYI